MSIDLAYLIGGAALLVALALPTIIKKWALSSPIVLVTLGLIIGRTPAAEGMSVRPGMWDGLIEHVAELTVLVSLMGVGLALDRPLSLKSWATFPRWHTTWRLLGYGMPLSIVATTLVAMGLLKVPLAAALLLGAVLAPTDPVLAADVQVLGPTAEELDEIGERDEVRFALTSEAGFNDALAFPFVVLSIYLAEGGGLGEIVPGWFAWDIVGKTLIGGAVGVAIGWLFGVIVFHDRSPLRELVHGEPLLALGATLVSYGVAEALHGWGFLTVFVCGLALRSAARNHEYHGVMHNLIEQFELLLTLLVLLLLGISCADGLLGHLDLAGAGLAVAVVLLIRPVTAGLALLRSRRPRAGKDDVGLGPREWAITSFFGVRGIGSIYYLAYATGAAAPAFGDMDRLWSVVGFTILLSVLVHGVLATPAMRWVEAKREQMHSDTV